MVPFGTAETGTCSVFAPAEGVMLYVRVWRFRIDTLALLHVDDVCLAFTYVCFALAQYQVATPVSESSVQHT